jgi:hypothetical protein
MLYTVTPLERIYSCRTKSLIQSTRNSESFENEEKNEFIDIALPHGRVYAKRDGDHYIVDGISSTDMNDYLNKDYMPGTSITNSRNHLK